MGDYAINNKGQDVKIGTCGAGYYTTFKMLENLKQKNSDVKHYLKGEGISCAFPFPEYDDKECGEISQFHSDQKIFFSIEIPKDLKIYHSKVSHHLHPREGINGGVNVYFECPYENENISTNFDKNKISLLLEYEYRKEGKGHIQCTCPYCDEQNYFDIEEIKKILEYNLPPLYEKLEIEKNRNSNNYNIDNINLINRKIEIYKRIENIYNLISPSPSPSPQSDTYV